MTANLQRAASSADLEQRTAGRPRGWLCETCPALHRRVIAADQSPGPRACPGHAQPVANSQTRSGETDAAPPSTTRHLWWTTVSKGCFKKIKWGRFWAGFWPSEQWWNSCCLTTFQHDGPLLCWLGEWISCHTGDKCIMDISTCSGLKSGEALGSNRNMYTRINIYIYILTYMYIHN